MSEILVGLGLGAGLVILSAGGEKGVRVPFKCYQQVRQPGWKRYQDSLQDFLGPLTAAGIHKVGLDFAIGCRVFRGLLAQ
jgi:hypothetical protein